MIYPTDPIFPEFWTNINIEGVCPYYKVSIYGRVFNGLTNTLLPQNINYNKDKYINIRLKRIDGSHIQEMMQRIVMYSFNYIDGCENLEVNHIDGVKYHNWLWNLEWVTHKENIKHAWETSLFNIGEDKTNSKITNKQAEDICKLLEQGLTPKEISEIIKIDGCNMFKISQNILFRLSWKHISKNYNIDNSKCRKSARRNKREGSSTIES